MFTSPLIAILTALPAVLSCAVPRSPDLSSISSIQSQSFPDLARSIPQGCSVSNITVALGSSSLSLVDGQSSSTIAVGRGIQNYTCTSGAYVSTGALANLFDMTCLYSMTAGKVDTNELSTLLPEMAFSALQYPDTLNLPVAIHHLFVDTPGSNTTGAISPLFVGSTDQVLVSKTAASNDVTDPSVNVPWLQLAAVEGQGTLAKGVYRLDTVNGQAPSTCDTEGEDLSVQYAAMYWFTN
ncbi:hypothetical protein B9479_007012 [Cryptococcus floricola]|uniref:Malate dehydrogenase n=1 Tax=Cryptococcus floricola TaxID=2591691 RepID=A0A5D3ANE4_9TREE|nr:hypothetical protein B9479_007012 [Cryptococcus floricola]